MTFLTKVTPNGGAANLAGKAIRKVFALAEKGELLRAGKLNGDNRKMGFFTDTTVCIGCKACEVACKQWNQLPAEPTKWTGNSYDNTGHLSETTWRHVAFVEQMDGNSGSKPRWLMMSDVCKHCEDAPCQSACPTGSLIYNEFGNVYVQPDICNGCGYCVVACPFGVIGRSEIDGHAHKCTMCYDRQTGGMEPACAKACPTDSIVFGPVEELHEKARKRVSALHARGETDAYLYGDEATEDYSAMNAFFLLKDRPSVYNLPDNPVRPNKGIGGRYLASLATGLALTGIAALVFGNGGRK